jgi:hypothetical protein
VDVDAVRVAVGEVGRILRADGGDLVLVEANPATLRVRLALQLEDVSCADCILPPDELEATIRVAIERRVPGEFELLVDDPRR